MAGVDSSTQSSKVELRDADEGRVLGIGRAPHPPVDPPHAEQDPDAWWAALRDALDQALEAAGRPHVDAIAVAAQQHGTVLVDRHGGVVRRALLWNDTRSAPEATALVARLGAEAWAQACGSVPVASFTVTKLAWLAAHEPASFGAARRVLLPHDWLTWRLTGEAVTDRGDASGTGYFSPVEDRWRPDLLALVDPDLTEADWLARLPRVLSPGEAAGPVRPDVAAELGLSPDTVVATGTGDNMGAALGLALGPGDVAISLGTSGTVFARADRPTADATGAVAGFAAADGGFLPLVCTLNCTQVTDTFAALLGVDAPRLAELALQAGPGADGLVLVPYLAGERTPDLPDATGTLAGLRTGVSREAVARAAHEGVVCGLLDGLDALGTAGVATDGRLLLVGGGARSAAYRRIVADLTGRVVEVPTHDELVAAGAAVQAAATLTGEAPRAVARRWGLDRGEPVEPGPGADAAPAIRARYARTRATT